MLKELREEFARLHTEAGALIKTATDAKRDLTPEEVTANEARFTRMDAIKQTLDQDKKLAGYAFTNGEAEEPAENPAKIEMEKVEQFAALAVGQKLDRQQFSKAVNNWARTGAMAMAFATITTATQSGILLPKEVAQPIVPSAVNTLREAHSLYGVDVLSTPSTEEIDYPVLDATSGGQVAENASAETENAPGLTESILLKCKTYQSGSVYFSNMQLAATAFDLFGATVPALTYSKELGLESTIMAAIIADAGITQTVATATTTGFTFNNLVSLNRKLAKRYDNMKVIVLSAAAYTAAEALVDSQGRPILLQDTQNQSLKRFAGTPVLRSDYLEAFGASKIVGIVFSLMGFKLRDVDGASVTRYTQVPAKPNQTGFNLFAYHAYGYAPSAIASLKTPIS